MQNTRFREAIQKWLPKKSSENKDRIHLLDEIRGFAVFCMVVYHGLFTFSSIFHFPWSTALLNFFAPAEPVFSSLFLFLSGIASNLSRSNLRRGIRLSFVAAAITLITVTFVPDQPIWFGILHLMAFAMILTGLLQRFFDRLPQWPCIAVCFAVTALTYDISTGYLGFFSIPLIRLPLFFYQTDWTSFIGIYSPSYFSADYFPLLPWLFVFLGGYFFGRYARSGQFPQWTFRNHIPFLSFIGRHALLIYIVHQPVFLGIGLLFPSSSGGLPGNIPGQI